MCPLGFLLGSVAISGKRPFLFAARGHRDEIGKAERPGGGTRSEVGYKSPHTLRSSTTLLSMVPCEGMQIDGYYSLLALACRCKHVFIAIGSSAAMTMNPLSVSKLVALQPRIICVAQPGPLNELAQLGHHRHRASAQERTIAPQTNIRDVQLSCYAFC
jgi:hypothetical protein